MDLLDKLERFRDGSWRYCFHSGAGTGKGQLQTSQKDAAAALKENQALTNSAQGTLGQFEGPVEDSPFYKALKTTGIESTSNAYGNARSNMRQKANLSGFGYSQPGEQGGEAQLGAQEAGALARVPQQALVEATGPALQAAGETGQLAGQQGQMATGFNQAATQSALQAQRNSLWNKLWAGPNNAGG